MEHQKAVIAEEVRNLAGKSAEALKYTANLISKVLESVKDGVNITDKVSAIIWPNCCERKHFNRLQNLST